MFKSSIKYTKAVTRRYSTKTDVLKNFKIALYNKIIQEILTRFEMKNLIKVPKCFKHSTSSIDLP